MADLEGGGDRQLWNQVNRVFAPVYSVYGAMDHPGQAGLEGGLEVQKEPGAEMEGRGEAGRKGGDQSGNRGGVTSGVLLADFHGPVKQELETDLRGGGS